MDNNLETRNDYLLKKKEKEKMLKEQDRNKMIKKYFVWLVVALLIVVCFWFIYDYFHKSAQQAARVPGEYFQAQSRDHIDIGAKHDAYNSNPPTGGWHYPTPAQTGIYDTPFPDEQLIHNLEHGHIWIAYKPNLPADQIEKLADIAKSYGSKIIMTPREANDSPIAIVAWEHLFKLDSVDEPQIKVFIDAYRGHGPEIIPDFGFQDFRKK
jgi:hypothetical protein